MPYDQNHITPAAAPAASRPANRPARRPALGRAGRPAAGHGRVLRPSPRHRQHHDLAADPRPDLDVRAARRGRDRVLVERLARRPAHPALDRAHRHHPGCRSRGRTDPRRAGRHRAARRPGSIRGLPRPGPPGDLSRDAAPGRRGIRCHAPAVAGLRTLAARRHSAGSSPGSPRSCCPGRSGPAPTSCSPASATCQPHSGPPPDCTTPAALSPRPTSGPRSSPSESGKQCSSSPCMAGRSAPSPAARSACSQVTASSSAWARSPT